MRPFLLFAIISLIALNSVAQNCNCEQLLQRTRELTEKNYAGWFDQVNENNRQRYDQWTNEHIAKARQIKSDSLCAVQIQRWLGFFNDKNLRLSPVNPRYNSDGSLHTPKTPVVTKTIIPREQIQLYLGSSHLLDTIEGIYRNHDFTFALLRQQKQFYNGVILSSQNQLWEEFDTKFELEKLDGSYNLAYITDDKKDTLHLKAKLNGNILELGDKYFERVYPEREKIFNLIEYEMERDPLAPRVVFINDLAAVWTFPGFGENFSRHLQYLLEKHSAEFEKIPDWIIDLRGNQSQDFEPALPFAKYFNPGVLVKPALEIRAEEQFTRPSSPQSDSIYTEVVSVIPKRVALLVNKQTAAAAEVFTLIARQSNKVKIYGQKTSGAVDYTGPVAFETGCPTLQLQIPLQRMLWLNEGVGYNKSGIQPDLMFATDDWIATVLKEWEKK